LAPGDTRAECDRNGLKGNRHRLLFLGAFAGGGGLTGSVLLLTPPGSVFRDVVPTLILVAVGLVLTQPRLAVRWPSKGSSLDCYTTRVTEAGSAAGELVRNDGLHCSF
jgi:hypothetical protein